MKKQKNRKNKKPKNKKQTYSTHRQTKADQEPAQPPQQVPCASVPVFRQQGNLAIMLALRPLPSTSERITFH
jgi:hypothetical protein